jgi:hypothetical protein
MKHLHEEIKKLAFEERDHGLLQVKNKFQVLLTKSSFRSNAYVQVHSATSIRLKKATGWKNV